MPEQSKIQRFADLLLAARASVTPLADLPEDILPGDAAEADAVQFLWADKLGPIGGYKVFQVGDRDGSLGVIPASAILASPAVMKASGAILKIELEIAFRIGRDLTGRADGAPYSPEEVTDAVAGAFAVFEIVETRLPPSPPALAARADAMSNRGLVLGTEVADWRGRVRADVPVSMAISGRSVVAAAGGHPSGDPFHPMPWLANALVRAGRPLAADQVVTTGAMGGAHPIAPGDTILATIDGFAPISFRLEA